jgi:YD repeat-containing protein
MIQEIALLNYFRDTIISVQLEQQGRLLRKITIKSPKNLFSKVQQFSYFDALNDNTGEDIFGYYNGTPPSLSLNTSGAMYPYITVPSEFLYNISNNSDLDLGDGSHDSQHVKRYSLKNIKTSRGGEIELDYEPNQLHFFGNNIEFGGLRLKNMLLRDENGNVDSIQYHYTREDGKGSGKFVLNGLSQGKTLYYTHCIDNVLMEGVEDIGNGILNTGNNGIIYDYVREECSGSGSTTYYFFVPLMNYGISNESYPYWLMGLPLGKIEYDETGHMVSMQKNKYASLENNLQDFFQITNDYAPFNKVAKQLKPFGFYIDGEKLENDYKSRPNVMLYRNRDFVYMMNPYRDQYLPNIAPRTYIILPDQAYVLYYGGKVILKETSEYLFNYTPDSTTTTSEPKYMDLYSTLPSTGYVMNKISFQYSPKHCDPVRVTRTRSDGEQVDTYQRIVADLDFEEVNPVLQEMITGNMLSPVLQEQVFLTRDSITKLISERHVQYDKDSMEGKNVYFPTKIFDLSLPEPQEVSTLPLISSFTYLEPSNENDYTVTKFSYNKPGKVYRLEESIMSGEVSSVVHDKGNGKPVLVAKNTRRAKVDAMDKYRVLEMTSWQFSLILLGAEFLYFPGYENVMSIMQEFLDKTVQVENQIGIYHGTFLQSELHQAMKLYAQYLLYKQSNYFNDEYLYMGRRDTILAHELSLRNEYIDFFKKDNASGYINYEYLDLAECVLNYAKYFTSERMEACKFNASQDLAGFNTGSTLKVTPQEHLYNLYYVVNSSQGDNGMLNCKVIYSDETSYTFSKPFTIASSGWRVNVLEIDLNEIPGKENIVSLEASTTTSYTSLSRGIVLSVLVPAGTEFEAVSRDQLGRVFCKLNHLQQFERYEYDGRGRVVKVFDARGNVLNEFEYNEIALTN